MALSLANIFEAQNRILNLATRTPLRPSAVLSKELGCSISLKMETMQVTGAFKLRGAANAILCCEPEKRRRGVVCASSGNHGRAIAYVARALNIPAVICLSDLVPPAKVEAVRQLGAELHVGGKDQDAAIEVAHEIADKRGMTYIDPFDNINVIAGAATIGLEILMDNPTVDTIVAQVSGGGLLGGIAFAAKTIKPNVKIIGVSMERGAAMYHSIQAGQPTQIEELPTIADALQGGIGLNNRFTFDLCNNYVDEFYTITEEQIEHAMVYAYRNEHLMLEGSGACGIGMLLDPRASHPGKDIVAICSGDNVDPDFFHGIIDKHSRGVNP